MSVGVRGDTAHAQLGDTLEQTVGDMAVGSGNSVQRAENGQDAIVDTGDDFADACADASLVTEFGDVLASFSNNDACFLRGDDGSQGELSDAVLLFSAGREFLVVVVLQGKVVHTGVQMVLFFRHDVGMPMMLMKRSADE